MFASASTAATTAITSACFPAEEKSTPRKMSIVLASSTRYSRCVAM